MCYITLWWPISVISLPIFLRALLFYCVFFRFFCVLFQFYFVLFQFFLCSSDSFCALLIFLHTLSIFLCSFDFVPSFSQFFISLLHLCCPFSSMSHRQNQQRLSFENWIWSLYNLLWEKTKAKTCGCLMYSHFKFE